MCGNLIIRIGDLLSICILIGSLTMLTLYRVLYVEEQLCIHCSYIWLLGGQFRLSHDVDVFMVDGF